LAIQSALMLHIKNPLFLANELARNKHLISQFPNLQIQDIDSKLEEILKIVKEKDIKGEQANEEIDAHHVFKGESKNQGELEKVLMIRNGAIDEDAKRNLRLIYYRSNDPVVKLNALLGLLDQFKPIDDNPDDFMQLCDEGIAFSDSIGAMSVKAFILAKKGFVISFVYSSIDIEITGQILAGNATGFQIITEEYRQEIVDKLNNLKNQFDSAFNEAINLTKSKKDYHTLADILIIIGSAAGNRTIHLQGFGIKQRAALEKGNCKRALLAAKEIYSGFNDELGVANALYNLANQIRFFGEEEEALDLAKSSLNVAQKYKDKALLKNAQLLIRTLETGEIPDYMAGERRE